MAFDVLAVDAIDMRGCPWAKRRRTLEELHDQAPDDIWRVNTAFADGPGLLAATAGMGLEGVVAKRVTSRYWPGRRTPYWRKVKHRTFEWFELLGWRAPAGRDPGGLLAGRAGRDVACAFPSLPASERGRFAALVADHGVEVPGGVRLPGGLAEVEVGYLELLPGGRLREPVARAIRAGGKAKEPAGSYDAKRGTPGTGGASPAWHNTQHLATNTK
jgi:hypothetical protein